MVALTQISTLSLIAAVEKLREADANVASRSPDQEERKVYLNTKEEAWELVNAELEKARTLCLTS